RFGIVCIDQAFAINPVPPLGRGADEERETLPVASAEKEALPIAPRRERDNQRRIHARRGSCQAGRSIFSNAEFPLLRNGGLGPFSTTVLPVALARRAATTEEGDELAPLHSITSSAAIRRTGFMLRTSRNDHDVAWAADPLFAADGTPSSPLSIHTICSFPTRGQVAALVGWSYAMGPPPGRPNGRACRRQLLNLRSCRRVCRRRGSRRAEARKKSITSRSAGKAANEPKPTSVGITSSQIRIAFGVAWSRRFPQMPCRRQSATRSAAAFSPATKE